MIFERQTRRMLLIFTAVAFTISAVYIAMPGPMSLIYFGVAMSQWLVVWLNISNLVAFRERMALLEGARRLQSAFGIQVIERVSYGHHVLFKVLLLDAGALYRAAAIRLAREQSRSE